MKSSPFFPFFLLSLRLNNTHSTVLKHSQTTKTLFRHITVYPVKYRRSEWPWWIHLQSPRTTIKMEAASSYETSVFIYLTRRHVPVIPTVTAIRTWHRTPSPFYHLQINLLTIIITVCVLSDFLRAEVLDNCQAAERNTTYERDNKNTIVAAAVEKLILWNTHSLINQDFVLFTLTMERQFFFSFPEAESQDISPSPMDLSQVCSKGNTAALTVPRDKRYGLYEQYLLDTRQPAWGTHTLYTHKTTGCEFTYHN